MSSSSCSLGAIFSSGAWMTWAPRRSKASMRSAERRSEVTAMRYPASGVLVTRLLVRVLVVSVGRAVAGRWW